MNAFEIWDVVPHDLQDVVDPLVFGRCTPSFGSVHADAANQPSLIVGNARLKFLHV